ncbi:MAG: Calx-beta domain-containing protein [Chitinophagales bacterium]
MKYLINYLLLLLTCSPVFYLNAQNTPAGIGGAYDLNLWLSAEDISGLDDGDPLSVSWIDRSGNEFNASQSDSVNQPTYHESAINGFPVLRFDGDDDFLDGVHSYSARTVFIVFKMSNTLQKTTDLAQLWGNDADGVHIAAEPRAGSAQKGFSFEGLGSSNTRAQYALNSNAYSRWVSYSNTQAWNYNQFELVAVEFKNVESINRQVFGSLYPNQNIGDHQFGGDIAEIIVFADQLGETQKILVENYLAAKYNLTISNDLFAYNLTHKHDLAGIGRITGGDNHTEGYSAGMLGLKESTALNNGAYALIAHNNGAADAWTTAETPINLSMERISREWKIGLTGAPGATVVVLDTSDLPAKSNPNSSWVLLISSDGNFTTNPEIHFLDENAGKYQSNALQLNDGDHYTIAALETNFDFTQNNFSALESEDSITISIALDLPFNDAINFTLQTTDSTALSPDDYQALNASYSIPAGDTLIQIGIQLVNDLNAETDEFIKLKMIPDNTDLFEEKTAIATIHDDDNTRKVSFQMASMSGAESVSNIPVNVVLNEVDSTNATTVKYRLKGGTATNAVDYTLTEGTLTFPPSSVIQSFDITVIDDAIYETNETIILELFDPSNCNISDTDPKEFTYTITDNDPAPKLNFTIPTMSKTEGNYSVDIPLELSAASGIDVNFEYSIKSATASSGSDYIFNASSSIIISGDTGKVLSLQILEDNITEADETVIIRMNVLSGAETGSDSIFTLTINDNDVFGYSGPGGVGDSALNTFWLDASSISGIASGNAINTNWPDNSGNDHHVSQVNAAYQPTYIENEINGLPVVRFDGANDFLDNSYNYDIASGIIVMKVNSATQQNNQQAQVIGNYAEAHFAFDPSNGNNVRGMTFNGSTTEKGRFRLNGGAYTTYAEKSNTQQWAFDDFFIVSADFENTISFTRMVIGSMYPSFTVGQQQFGGDIAEIILFQNHLNEAQKTIIENYLAVKYGIAISNDNYSFDATHPHNLVGIGRAGADDLHINSKSAGILKLDNPVALSDGDYVFAGHDNQNISAWQSAGAPNASTRMLERQWRIDATNANAELNFSVDTSDLPALPSGFTAWALLVDEDGDFTQASMFHYLDYNNQSNYTSTNVKVNSGDYIAIAAVKNISAGNGNFADASTWAGAAPESTDTVIIAANHTVELNGDVSSAHLYISGYASLELGSNTLSINEGSMEIYGTLDMGTGTISYAANGNQSIAHVTYNNLKLEGSGFKTLNGNTIVNGNLILDAGTLDANNSSNYSLQVAGNWVNNGGAFEPRNAEVELNGAVEQSITSNGTAFYDLTISGSGPYQLLDDVSVNNVLNLQNGIISTQSNKLIISNSAEAAITNYSTDAFINGNLERAVTSGDNEYFFPVGNGENTTNYHPAEVASNSLVGVNNITVYFSNVERHSDEDMEAVDSWLDYQALCHDGLWIITPDQQPSGGTYNVKLYIINMAGLEDNKFAVIKRPEGAPDAKAWSAQGSINAKNGQGRKISDGYALRMDLSSFSEFGIGEGSESGDGLPVELMYFNAFKNGDKAQLEWLTATEINSDAFEIQRSDNAIDFKSIGRVEAQGNSVEEVEYVFIDKKPLKGDNYYRLKQIDKDGQYEIFPVKQVYFDTFNKEIEVNIYPNPSNGKHLNIDLKNIAREDQRLELKIYDTRGRQVFEYGNFVSENNKIILNESLTSGIYILDIQIEKFSQKVKWIIN